ncbi:MAG: tyrosine-type recombinase/integrase [Hyphomicrobium sp.]|jgi:integrase
MPARKAKVTLAAVKLLLPSETIYDTETKGFGIRRQLGPVSYFVKTRIKGRQRWITIGKHGSPWTPETARKEARRILTEADNGFDRLAAKQKESAASTFEQVAKRFVEVYGPKLKPRTLKEYQKLIDRYLTPEFGTRRIDAIERSDVAHAHAKWGAHPRTANHSLAVLSKIMSWAEEHTLRPEQSNPCLRQKKYREIKRQRYLSAEEIKRLGSALASAEAVGDISIYAGNAIRLLILTGARLNEILTLRWSYVDVSRRLLILPDSKTGEKSITLNAPAIDVLETIPRIASNSHVIVGHRTGSSMVDIFKPWSIVRARAKLDDVRIHDLRHTFASVAVAAGGSLPMIGKMLGHNEPKTTQRYAHLSDDPIARLSEATASQISHSLSRR